MKYVCMYEVYTSRSAIQKSRMAFWALTTFFAENGVFEDHCFTSTCFAGPVLSHLFVTFIRCNN
jgi:hypothetical protein